MRWWLVVAAGCALGCGSSDDDGRGSSGGTGGTGGAGGTSGTGGSAAGGSAGAAVGGSGGTNAAGASGSGGSAGTPSVDCTGSFGEPTVVFTNAPSIGLGSLTLRADELELIYAEAPFDETLPRHFRRSVRAGRDVPFTAGEVIAPLDAACADDQNRTGELTRDGLRFYFTCYIDFEDEPNAIRLARRPSVDAPFVVDSTTYGVARSGLALDTDELTVFTSGSTEGSAPFARRRTTTADPFGDESPLTGLDGWVTLTLSSDGRQLYGASYTEADRRSLLGATRSGPTEFAAPTVVRTFAEPVYVFGSPAISADCRTLYYVSVTEEPVYGLMLMRR
jgi:hypothetical protein